MPQKYKKKTSQGSWSRDSLRSALRRIKAGDISIRKAMAQYGIPRSTLQDYMKRDSNEKLTRGRDTVFSAEAELELVRYTRVMSSQFYGLTKNDLRRLA